jgi:hypothetical protein
MADRKIPSLFKEAQTDVSQAFKLVFKDRLYGLLAVSFGLNLLLVYYLIFLSRTTLSLFFETTQPFYAWTMVILTLVSAVLFGLAVSWLVFRWQEKKIFSTGEETMGCLAGALSMGCPVCGSLLLPFLGLAGGLAIFPFQGLELKIGTIFFFGYSIFVSSQALAGKFRPVKKILTKKEAFKATLVSFLPLLILAGLLALPLLPGRFKISFAKEKTSRQNYPTKPSGEISTSAEAVLAQINPAGGYEINARFNDVGPKLLEAGAIDFNKFKEIYDKGGRPLTDSEIKILTQESREKIKITSENSHFLLNFFWALGLANKNKILDQGPMKQYGLSDLGNFASTGGWTLGVKEAIQLYSQSEIVKLNDQQQRVVEEFANNSYRPCCSNPTAFPDCNHGMAALGLAELMASQGATRQEIFDAFKYFNSFWFPQTYFDLATYFQAREGKSWAEVDSATIAGQNYSTPQGWQRVRGWLQDQGLLEKPPEGGGGCGV